MTKTISSVTTGDEVRTTVMVPSYYGEAQYTVEVVRAKWSAESVRLKIAAGRGLDIILDMQADAIPVLIDALYRAKMWEPQPKKDEES